MVFMIWFIKKTNFVESKWGVGNMYRHGLEEVPLRYGVPQRFKLHGTKKEFQNLVKSLNQNRNVCTHNQ